ncbi:MAG: hypothetical protein EU530_04040 [Promethearchaeota archaeon]|nr:MAG: hypothetical protein EU530_04040 [Candidatus Lokiarchaeota archaeon]
MLKKRTKYVLLISFVVLLSATSFTQMARGHSPKFIDVKFYLDDQILSVYYTHGVSNTSYHYVETVVFEFYNISSDFTSQYPPDPDYTVDKITQHDFHYYFEDHPEDFTLIAEFNETYTKQEDDSLDTQDTQIFHHNYTIADYNATLDVEYWTYIRVTAYCKLGGQYTNDIIAGHWWWDEPHSFMEALLPTALCTFFVLLPIIVWSVIGKIKEKRKVDQEVTR